MVDITKCTGKDCPKKKKCYRYTSKADPHWQSYAEFEGVDGKTDCRDFWKDYDPSDEDDNE